MDVREILLIIYSGSKLFQPWSMQTTPYLLTLLAFMSRIPAAPSAEDFAYSILLLVFAWNILELHLPHPPSPVYLLPPPQIIPLATIVWHGLSHIFLPVLVFFLPALLVSMFLLSTSLSDIIPMIPLSELHRPTPMEVRVAFLSLIAVLFLLMLCTLAMLVLVYPFLSSSDASTNYWDRYSRSVGLEARRLYVHAVVKYAAPYAFPAPFNLIQSITRVVQLLVGAISRKDVTVLFQRTEVILWRIFIAPITCILEGLFKIVDFVKRGRS